MKKTRAYSGLILLVAAALLLAGCDKSKLSSVTSRIPKISLPKFGSSKEKKSEIQELLEKAEGGDHVAQAQLGDKYYFCVGTDGNLNEAFKWYSRSAQSGNHYALYMLGVFYENGLGTEKDAAKAMEYYEKAAENGSMEAQATLGDMFSYGANRDKIKALKWYAKLFANCSSSEYENKDYYLGLCYFYGKGTEQNVKAGLKLMNAAGKRGYGRAYFGLADVYLNGDNVAKSSSKAKSYAEKGAKIMGGYGKYRLAKIQEDIENEEKAKEQEKAIEAYSSSDDFTPEKGLLGMLKKTVLKKKQPPKPKKAKKEECVKYYKQAAELSFAPAQYEMGLRERRAGNTKEAFDWYVKAAENGYPTAAKELDGRSYEDYLTNEADHGDIDAQYKLGQLFIKSQDSQRQKNGFELLKLADEGGVKEARYDIANCYYYGKGTTPDKVKAISLFNLEAEAGNCGAQYIMGLSYKNGDCGLPKDQSEALKWFLKAAEQNHKQAAAEAGLCYLTGDDSVKDEAKAFAFLSKGAASEDDEALYYLGTCYENGIGTSKDPEKALGIYSRIAYQNAKAFYKVGRFYKEGIVVEKDKNKALEYFCSQRLPKTADLSIEIADIYYFGDKGYDPNYKRAVEYYSSDVLKNSAYAKFRMGECYQYGRGVSKGLRKASHLYKEAFNVASKNVELGKANSSDQYCLGMCYEYGKGVDKDIKKAISCYKLGKDFNDASEKIKKLTVQEVMSKTEK